MERRRRVEVLPLESLDVRECLFRMTGQDLTRPSGFGAHSVMIIVSEVGLDMSVWPTEKHFASWLCLCPGHHKTGGKNRSGRQEPQRADAAQR